MSLTTDLLTDVNNMIPLSLINLLILKSRVVMPPPEVFAAPDICDCKHEEGCSRFLMSFAVDGKKVLATLQNVNINGMALEETAK